jgi:hypothetical protein
VRIRGDSGWNTPRHVPAIAHSWLGIKYVLCCNVRPVRKDDVEGKQAYCHLLLRRLTVALGRRDAAGMSIPWYATMSRATTVIIIDVYSR